ncbi:hypothetical protein [Polymorphospora lycopeni]|uniref:Uncharacterized protein n=1 Tax=Polymorphospora lycopeni TaxID=3140240 RepID=A0ABV5CKS1_9ACTN
MTTTTPDPTETVAYSRTSDVANIVLTAAGRLDGRLQPAPNVPADIAAPLAAMLQNIGDAMNDDWATETEHPDHIPSHRWLVQPGYSSGVSTNETWTDALRLARAILGQPDPNATGDGR